MYDMGRALPLRQLRAASQARQAGDAAALNDIRRAGARQAPATARWLVSNNPVPECLTL